MARRDLHLWIVSDDRTDMKEYRASRELVRLGIAAVLLVVAFLGSAATQLFHKAETSLEHHKLVRKTALLETELAGIETRLDTLRQSLQGLAASDEKFRLIAGLEPLDADVQAVGIGGPGTETLATNPLYRIDAAAAGRTYGASMEVDQLLRRARLLAFSWREAGDALHRKYEEFATTPSILPTNGYIASTFSHSRWHPILGVNRPHLGVDIVAPTGTPVVASANGRISFAGRRSGYGNVVEIDHGSGRMTRYAHLSKITVRVGQQVERGNMIGNVGMTGLAAAPHLHYEVIVNGRQANPRTYILEGNVIPD
jgi:murein DD-endopeptidase MepM/ murein hydrolase activator NlpD